MVVAENVFYVMGAPVSQQNSTQKCINAVFLLGYSSEKNAIKCKSFKCQRNSIMHQYLPIA